MLLPGSCSVCSLHEGTWPRAQVSGMKILPVLHAEPHTKISPETLWGHYGQVRKFWKSIMHGIIFKIPGLW